MASGASLAVAGPPLDKAHPAPLSGLLRRHTNVANTGVIPGSVRLGLLHGQDGNLAGINQLIGSMRCAADAPKLSGKSFMVG